MLEESVSLITDNFTCQAVVLSGVFDKPGLHEVNMEGRAALLSTQG